MIVDPGDRMQDFRNLTMWQKTHALTLVYRTTQRFPCEKLFTRTQQMRQSAMSVPTNCAEGCGRGNNTDFGRFLWIANGSEKSWMINSYWPGISDTSIRRRTTDWPRPWTKSSG